MINWKPIFKSPRYGHGMVKDSDNKKLRVMNKEKTNVTGSKCTTRRCDNTDAPYNATKGVGESSDRRKFRRGQQMSKKDS